MSDTKEALHFTVASYNILAAAFSNKRAFPTVPAQYRQWGTRKTLLLSQLKQSNADILCLQELDKRKQMDSELQQIYKSEHLRRDIDGISIYWKQSVFRFITSHKIRFDEITEEIDSLAPKENRSALVIELMFKQTGKHILIANTHLEWKPSFDHIKIMQGAILLKEIKKIQRERGGDPIPFLICGDFNSMTTSRLHLFYSTGKMNSTIDSDAFIQLEERYQTVCGEQSRPFFLLTKEQEEIDETEDLYEHEEENNVILRHPFHLKSVYEKEEKTKNFVTNFKEFFREVLDYIWYEPATLTEISHIKLPGIQELAPFGTLPNIGHPSDHLMLKATFTFTSNSQ